MSNFIKEAIAERARLTKQIQMLDALISGFNERLVKSEEVTSFANKKDAVYSYAIDCIKAEGGHANAATIFAYVAKHGVKISRNVLKNYLYKCSALKSNGRKGFALKHRS